MTLSDFITVTEVADGPAVVGALFRRAYKKDAPAFRHHIVAFYHGHDTQLVPVSYVHFTDCGDIYLAGGACTDGDALRAMSTDQQRVMREYGGLMLATLRHGFEKYQASCEAIFTCCGDRRALETTPKLGFEETGVQYLLANFSLGVSDARRRELIAKAESFMPF